MRSFIIKLLTGVFVSVFLISGWNLYQIHREYESGKEQYKNLMEHVSSEAADGEDTDQIQNVSQCPEVDFEELRKINSDVAAWLSIDGTQINYPVVHGDDNDFYLNHRFDGQYNSAGCLFLDVENDGSFQQTNQIIYGHYMKNQSMFHNLTNYKEQSYFDEHPEGWLITSTGAYRLKFFTGYVSDVYGDAWNIKLSEDEAADWLNDCKEKSVFSSDVVPDSESKILTLSTCSYEFENARFVLQAIMQPVNER